ncbi:MAG: response regulator [Calditrichae bacterium]|nr:response regulator [Calditrichota bacterium]MCB9058748.1 response regulator [Calditrichia bacterium]
MIPNDVQILLVEDNPADSELTMDALRDRNLANQVHHVEDGQQAVDFLFGQGKYSGRNTDAKPKLILLDLKLPKLSGLDVLQIIKKDERTRTIPVVVLTSSREEKDLIESYQLGVNSYVTKPVNFNDFSEAVANLGMYWLILNQQPE